MSNPPSKDLKVRQAIAAAVDPKVINDRGYSSKGLVGNQLFQSDFRWYADVAGPKVDPEAAKKLVTDAKATGWDGKIRLLYNSSPAGAAIGLADADDAAERGHDGQPSTPRRTSTGRSCR